MILILLFLQPPQSAKEAGGSAENLDIDLTDPELNKAAVKIQANFRGFTQRSRKEADKSASNQEANRKNQRHGDPDRAATKIQANIRGYLTRKAYKAGTLKPAPREPKKKKGPKRPTTFEDQAASKIQAGVR